MLGRCFQVGVRPCRCTFTAQIPSKSLFCRGTPHVHEVCSRVLSWVAPA